MSELGLRALALAGSLLCASLSVALACAAYSLMGTVFTGSLK